MVLKNKIEDSFEDRRMTLLLGFSFWAYFVYHFTADKSATRVLPVMDSLWYVIILFLVLAAQVAVWIYFKHFTEEKWNRKILALGYFLCELGVLYFTICLILWPIFLMFRTKLI